MKKFSLIGLCFAAAAAVAAEPEIYFSFDKNANADISGVIGVPSAQSTDKTPGKMLAEGVSGKALRIGNSSDKKGKQTIVYTPKTALSGTAGTISFWVKPEDWSPAKSRNFHHFFGAAAKNGERIIVYKYNENPRLIFRFGFLAGGKPYTAAAADFSNWETGSWHHVTCAWDEKVIELYLDGKLAAQSPRKNPPVSDFVNFRFGEYWSGDPGNSLLDEVKIFRTKLSAAEVKAEFDKKPSAPAEKAAPAAPAPAAKPDIYFSFDKSSRADFGGVPFSGNEIAGVGDELGVIGVLSKESSDKTADKMLGIGLSGKALKIGNSSDKKGKQTIVYTPQPALSSKAGTVSFWMKPEDWSPAKSRNFHHFFGAAAKSGERIIIYKYNENSRLVFRLGGLAAGKPYTTAAADFSKWETGTWHHVTCSWDEKVLELYFDGQKVAQSPRKNPPADDFINFRFGEYWGGNPGNTLLDEVKIYQRKLNDSEVKQEYMKNSSKAVSGTAPVVLGVPRKSATPDGVVTPGEYSIGISGMNNSMNAPVQFSEKQSSCFLAWDEENIYAAIVSPAEKPLKISQSGVDCEVWLDDAVEIFFAEIPGNKAFYQLIFNGKDGIYDAKDRAPAWNLTGAKWQSKVIDGKWHFEAAIPWKNFGFTPQPGASLRMNFCREYKEGNKWTSLAPGDYFAVPNYAMVKLLPAEAPAVMLDEFTGLYDGDLKSSLSVKSMTADKISARISIKAAVFPFNFEETFAVAPGKEAKFKLDGKAPESGNVDITINSDKYGILYRNTLTYKNLLPVRLSCIYTDIPSQTLIMEMENLRLQSGKNKIQVVLKDASGKVVYDRTATVNDNVVKDPVKFAIAQVPNGEYELHYTIFDANGKKLAADMEGYAKYPEKRPWSNTRYGLADMVPPPWSAPVADGRHFACWGREMKFGKGMIASITSQKQELLARPVTMRFNGKLLDFNVSMVEKKNNCAVYKFTPVDKNVALEVLMTAEFDGLMWFTVKMLPGLKVHDLALIIPLDRKNVTGFDDNADIVKKIDLLRAGNGSFFIDPVVKPFFWCGGDDVGIMGGSSDRHGWYLKNKPRGMKVSHDNSSVTIALNFVDTQLNVAKARQLEFYLQPTPVKPKNMRMRGLRQHDNMIAWGEYVTLYFGHKRPGKYSMRHIEYFRDQQENHGQAVFYYNAPKGASPVSPEWNYFGKLWHCAPPNLGEYMRDAQTPNRKARNMYLSTWGCMNCRDFFEFKLDSIAGFTNEPEFKVKNLYFDLCWPRFCNNPEHGCSWTDEFGYQHRDSDLKALREFMKRLYINLKIKDKDGLFRGHTISTRLPSDAFFDSMVLGELYDRHIVNKVSYFDVLYPDLMRVGYASRNAEMPTAFIPQFSRALMLFAPDKYKKLDPNEPELDRAICHYLGYMLVHDLGSSPTPKDSRMKEFYAVRDRLAGRDGDYTFYPYWKNDSPVQPNFAHPRRMVSAFGVPGKASVVMLNDTDEAATFSLTLDCTKLGISPNREGVELFSGEKVKLVNGKLVVTAGARGVKAVVFD